MPKNRVQFSKDAACPLSGLSSQNDFEPIGAVLRGPPAVAPPVTEGISQAARQPPELRGNKSDTSRGHLSTTSPPCGREAAWPRWRRSPISPVIVKSRL